MTDIDLGALSLDELKKLQKDVNKAVETYEHRRRQEAIAAAEAKLKELGFTLADLTKQKPARAANPPKYQHPENSAKTWSGRGRQPEWIKEGLQAGKSLEDFLIEK